MNRCRNPLTQTDIKHNVLLICYKKWHTFFFFSFPVTPDFLYLSCERKKWQKKSWINFSFSKSDCVYISVSCFIPDCTTSLMGKHLISLFCLPSAAWNSNNNRTCIWTACKDNSDHGKHSSTAQKRLLNNERHCGFSECH